MRVLLIRPPYTRLKGVGQAPYFPLGLGYVAAVLRDNGHEAKIYHAENDRSRGEASATEADVGFDFRSNSHRRYLDAIRDDDHPVWREVAETLREFRPDVVGISVLSVEVASALKLSRISKRLNKKCFVVWGGLHPTFLPEDCLLNPEVDAVIRGEGEYPMLDLCRALESGSPVAGIGNLSHRDGGQVVNNPVRAPIPDIDAVPFPARESVLYPESFDFKSFGSMIISRGCPFRCSFCSSRNFWDKKLRSRSPENFVSEIVALQKAYGTKYFMFWDDSFTINRKIVLRYCQAIIDAGLKINWKTATRADLLDEELLRTMRRAGCVKLEIGVESGSDRVKKLIHKDVTNDQVKRAFAMIDAAGIGAGAFFMAGFPEETLEDLDQTFALMRELEATELTFNIFDPMPGSAEYEKCIRLGLVPERPDWNNFPFWPDAHYVVNIGREEFSRRATEIARWLFQRNNSLAYKVRRNRQLVLFLLRNDPGFLLQKSLRFVRSRVRARLLRTNKS